MDFSEVIRKRRMVRNFTDAPVTDEPAALQRLLGIPDDWLPIGVAMIGHPAPDTMSGSLKRGHRKLDDVLHRERW